MHATHAPPLPSLSPVGVLPRLGMWLALLVGAAGLHAQTAPPTAQRQQELVRMVRQDCGSCHGLHLTGGLGPALTREALADKPLESMVATIYGGRPGTPMAPWKAMLSEADALWIAQQLFAGFPESVKERP
ncbi:cytochrome C55X NirC [Acidovorax carolinensis]|uniref:Cytochrome C55X NirC n=1 Tax=Acidovorax carolinensis TaxID=553814 RepID=A0A240TYR1_9BURK|nr:cytochrome c [Acidovorax carolinensis]ART50732.1 cytochrome C55X NirC [Acidovorax carolinensis]